MGQVKELMNQIMELKVTSKSFQRQARKCEKCMKSEKLKQKKAIEKGNMEAARIYAENVNRKRKEQIYYLGLSSKLDAVVARFDAQVQMIMISKSLGSIVKSLQSMGNSQKMPKTMGQFEKRVVNMKSLAREGEVNSLMQQAEYEALVGLPQSAGHTVANVTAEEDDLVTRFANLKAPC